MATTKDWIAKTIKDGGVDCGACGQWRGLYGDQYIETCPHCGDDEFDIYEVREEVKSNPR